METFYLMQDKFNVNIGEIVMYTGNNSYAFNKLVYRIMKNCLTIGEIYEVREVGYYHPTQLPEGEKNRKYYKLEGFATAFPWESFIIRSRFKSFIKSKYSLR